MSGVHAFPDSLHGARALAAALRLPCHAIDLHRFPDGESLVRVAAGAVSGENILFRSLDHPNDRLIEALLAASALRDAGARGVTLVAPYLCYMRQDTAFHPGEAVSQRVVGALLGGAFDRVVTVDPHLHRVARLDDVVAPARALVTTAAPAIAAFLAAGAGAEAQAPVLVGPDAESRQWVSSVAAAHDWPVVVGAKRRRGDRAVEIAFEDSELAVLKGRRAVLVDDVAASGETLAVAARALAQAGATRIEAAVTHALFGAEDAKRLRDAGIAEIVSCDGVVHPTNAIALAPVIASVVAPFIT